MPNKKRKSRKAVPGYTLIPMDGYYQAKKIGISGDRVKSDPAFALTRRNAAEFGYVAKMGKLIRLALPKQALKKHCATRLTSRLREVLKTDEVSDYGYRDLLHADLSKLVGFDFNTSVPLNKICRIQIQVQEQRQQQQLTVTVPSFIPVNDLANPCTANHFQISFLAVHLNTLEQITTTCTKQMDLMSYDQTETTAWKTAFNTALTSGEILVIAVLIEWYYIINHHRAKSAQSTLTFLYAKGGIT